METNYTNYSGKTASGAPVFEENVKDLLQNKKITTSIISPDNLNNFISSVEASVDAESATLEAYTKSIPYGQAYDLGIVKDIMSEDGRLLMHNDKNSLSENNKILANIVQSSITSPLESESYAQYAQPVYNDPSKNNITCSKIVQSCVGDNMFPIFTVNTVNCIRKHNIPNNQLGKLLLEVRISTPLLNFKGYITTGIIDGAYGIGFLADYCKSVDKNTFTIKAYMDSTGTVVTFYIVKTKKSITSTVYDTMIPTTINISPLICESISLIQSIPLQVSTASLTTVLVGSGDLTNNGHGPIDCILNSDNTVLNYIKSKYYRGNRDLTCLTSFPVKSRNTSKYFNLKLQPLSFGDPTPSTVSGSQVLKPTFGSNHFDMFNLLKQIYDFTDMKIYKCFGNIMLNNIIIPVVGFKLDKSSGRTSFMISPYFIIPDSMKFIDTGNCEMQSLGLRNPTIEFNTNVNNAYSFENHGYIGDVDYSTNQYMYGMMHGTPTVFPSKSNIFIMGYDNYSRAYTEKRANYTLSLIDINIEIPDCSGLLNQIQWNTPFRYSGDFNKFTYDFKKNDYDLYPFPGTDRNISDYSGAIVNVPSLVAENIVIVGSDDSIPYVWSDDKPADTYIAYSNVEIQQ